MRFNVAPIFHFTVGAWAVDRGAILRTVAQRFEPVPLAVRSSSLAEDGATASHAGAHRSCLAVDSRSPDAIAEAIDAVIHSYRGSVGDQVLVQPMITDVVLSGVIMTRQLDDGSPYYVLSYDDESGRTDSITGGTGVSKTVFVHRDCNEAHVDSPRVRQMLALARSVEDIAGAVPLDIEFGIQRTGEHWVFQVRPISTAGAWHADVERRVRHRLPAIEQFVEERSAPRDGVWGSRTILGNMPDWNPAEIIGATPRPLAAALYRDILTRDVWRQARERMGYRAMPAEELMVMICGRPFIDVRNSFNSFLPAGLDEETGARLVDAWLDRLDAHPELHDKVEFEVAFTARDCCFADDYEARYAGVLSSDQRGDFLAHLTALTNRCLDQTGGGSLAAAERAIRDSEARQLTAPARPAGDRAVTLVASVIQRIHACKAGGTLPFAILARHGFIAESLLRSAVRRGAIAPERVAAFKRSIQTILTSLTGDLHAVVGGRLEPSVFMSKYGHLRPGTYDVVSLTYRDRPDLFADAVPAPGEAAPEPFDLMAAERRNLDALLGEAGLRTDAAALLEYARRAIVGREHGKFVFTRDLSDALEDLVRWGRWFDLDRDDISHLTLDTMCDTVTSPVLDSPAAHFRELVERACERQEADHAVKMSYIIRGVRDLYVVPVHRALPNFITTKRADAPVAVIAASSAVYTRLEGRIAVIENADPGFDWIFTKGIRGLITKFGGANSHMAIRCAELGLPAAIGCGEYLFDLIQKARAVELNCAEKIVRPVHVD